MNHVVMDFANFTVVALQNRGDAEHLPAALPVNADLAKSGAEAILAADDVLKELLLNAGVLHVTSQGIVNASVTSFKQMFEDIAYVIVRPLPAHWFFLQKPACTCHIFGIQQQCQHTLFVESLPLTGIIHTRNFGDVRQQRGRGRPKGKAKAAAKRRHD